MKSKPKPDNPEQFKRFIETARQVEVDESPDALDRALDRVVPRRRQISAPISTETPGHEVAEAAHHDRRAKRAAGAKHRKKSERPVSG